MKSKFEIPQLEVVYFDGDLATDLDLMSVSGPEGDKSENEDW